jgi:hypothetical protein
LGGMGSLQQQWEEGASNLGIYGCSLCSAGEDQCSGRPSDWFPCGGWVGGAGCSVTVHLKLKQGVLLDCPFQSSVMCWATHRDVKLPPPPTAEDGPPSLAAVGHTLSRGSSSSLSASAAASVHQSFSGASTTAAAAAGGGELPGVASSSMVLSRGPSMSMAGGLEGDSRNNSMRSLVGGPEDCLS